MKTETTKDSHAAMKYDFAFLYEVKNRELESVLLLKNELEKRGYSACIVETWHSLNGPYTPVEADVVVSFALYNDGTMRFVCSFFKNVKKIINMQWEQIYTNGDAKREKTDHDTSCGIRGKAINAVHVCWGKHNYSKLAEEYGVALNNLILSGNVSLDFLRPEFDSFYLSREDLLRKYGILPNKKVYLFISSFSFVNMPSLLLNSPLYQNVGFNINEFARISIVSQNEILRWFEDELRKHPDVVIVYRPHPAENDNTALYELEKKYENFRVIGELSIKQWILRVDKIYTWWSTSIAEIYASGKGCEILRPVPIPYLAELEFLKDVAFTESFDSFDANYENCSPLFPVPESVMRSYYLIDDVPAYIRLVAAFEKVYNDLSHPITLPENNVYSNWTSVKRLLKKAVLGNRLLVGIIKPCFGEIIKHRGRTYNDLLSEYQYSMKMIKKTMLILQKLTQFPIISKMYWAVDDGGMRYSGNKTFWVF